MDAAAALVARGEASGCIAWAGAQDSGRGRFADRKWESPPGESLLFTLALADGASPETFPVSLRVALALCTCIESHGLKPQVKWPNDVLVNGKKISGILVIASGNWKYIGIGLNVRQRDFPQSELRRPATSLSIEGIELDARTALESLLPFLHDALFMDASRARAELERRLWSRRQETGIVERPGTPAKIGIIVGLDSDGALLLETAEGIVRCVTGE
jgi:BirA family biotin operon repressor/biotin-[acetyl-CoA-carboxylase] ligase